MADNKLADEIITVPEDTKAAETPKKAKKSKLEDIDSSNIIPENPETKRAMRLRTPTKRFLDEQRSQELDIVLPKGKGKALINIHNVNIKIHELKKDDLLLMNLFELIFGKTKKKVDVQKHILQFSGLQYHEPEKDKQQVKEKLEKWSNEDTINLMNLLDLNSKSDLQSELIEQIITFLENPQDSDNPKIVKEVPPVRKRVTKKQAATAETKTEEEEKELSAKRKHDELNVEDTSTITKIEGEEQKKEEEEPKKEEEQKKEEEEQKKEEVVTSTGATTIPITSTTSTDESTAIAPMKESEGQLETKETEKEKPEEDSRKLESPTKQETPEPPLKRQKVENEQSAVSPTVEPEKMEIEPTTTTNGTKVEKPMDTTTTS